MLGYFLGPPTFGLAGAARELPQSGAPPAGGLENIVLLGMVLQIWDDGILWDTNGLYGTREAFVQAMFPPNPTRK